MRCCDVCCRLHRKTPPVDWPGVFWFNEIEAAHLPKKSLFFGRPGYWLSVALVFYVKY